MTCAGLTLAALLAPAFPLDGVDRDKQKLHGFWVVESYTGLVRKGARYEISAEKLRPSHLTWDRGASYTIDPTKSPKQIDLVETADGKKFNCPGIYEIDGDTLKLAIANAPHGRPRAFDGKHSVLLILKRSKD